MATPPHSVGVGDLHLFLCSAQAPAEMGIQHKDVEKTQPETNITPEDRLGFKKEIDFQELLLLVSGRPNKKVLKRTFLHIKMW